MRKIKIKSKGFMTTHYGYFSPNTEHPVSDGFAAYCVDKMKSAEYAAQDKREKITLSKGKS